MYLYGLARRCVGAIQLPGKRVSGATLLAGEANIPKALGFLRLLLTAVHVTEKFIFSVCERAAAFSDSEKAAARLCFFF